jgi:hypothetical protein
LIWSRLVVSRDGDPVTWPVSASKLCVSICVEVSVAANAIRVPSRDEAACRSAPRPIVSGRAGSRVVPVSGSKAIRQSDWLVPASPLE